MASHASPRSDLRSNSQLRPNHWLRMAAILIPIALLTAMALDFWVPAIWNYGHFNARHYIYYWPARWWLVAHLLGGSLALLLGPFQFSTALRRRAPAVHRWMGRLYLSGVLLASLAATYIGLRVSPDHAFGIALVVLAFAWVTTSGVALLAALRRQFAVHKEWMVRSYVVTFAFVVFRFSENQLNLFHSLGRSNQAVMNAWICWTVPLLVANVVLDWRRVAGPRRLVRVFAGDRSTG